MHEKTRTDSSEVASGSTPPSSTFETFSLAAIFFLCMIVMELSMEAATRSFSHLDSLTSTITLFQFSFCVGIPAVVAGPRHALRKFPRKMRDFTPYIRLSLAVFGATALATHSLHYVSYPTKVVFKAAKLIPTMIVSTIVNPGSSFALLDYVSALLLCAGAAGYGYGQGGQHGDTTTSTMGIALLTTSVLCDAVVPNMQQKLMAPPTGYSALPKTTSTGGDESRPRGPGTGSGGAPVGSPGGAASFVRDICESFTRGSQGGGGLDLSAGELMTNVNAVGTICLFIFMVLSGSLVSAVTTAVANPVLLVYLVLIGLGLSMAVLAYTRLIKTAGSVVSVAVATLRKVATVVLSYIIFPKALLRIHIVSGVLVLAGICLNSYSRQRGRPSISR